MDMLDEEDCCGCGACAEACPRGAVALRENRLGFAVAVIDAARCVDCSRCVEVCPRRSAVAAAGTPSYFAARLKDPRELGEVSSGGVFWALAQAVFAENGVVYGAVREGRDIVRHLRADSMEKARGMRRSKYLPSDMSGCYESVRRDLADGRLVLFSGTGCQVAALRLFLGGHGRGLVTAEVVCHGVPSALAWRIYVSEHEQSVGKRVVDVVNRDKSGGWKNNHYRFIYDDGTSRATPSATNPFHFSYLHGLILRGSCLTCEYARVPRVADLSLADFWRYAGVGIPRDDGGVSLVAVNTEVGMDLMSKAASLLLSEQVTEEDARNSCRHMFSSPMGNAHRDDFLRTLASSGFSAAFSRWGGVEKRRKAGFFAMLARVVARKFGRGV